MAYAFHGCVCDLIFTPRVLLTLKSCGEPSGRNDTSGTSFATD